MSEHDVGGAPELPGLTPETPAQPTPDKSDRTGLRDTIKASIAKVNAEQSAKAPAAPAADSPEGKVSPAPTSGDDRERGPDGKFLPKTQAAPDKAAPKTDVKAPEGAKPDAVPTKDEAPGTWRASAKAKWEKADPDIKAEVLKRESESTREIAKHQQQIQQINQAYTPIEQVIGPKRALWRAQFGSEGEALKRLVNLSDLASQDPQNFLSYYLSQPDISGRIDLQKLFGQAAAGGTVQSTDPGLQAALAKINGLEQQVSGFISSQQTQAQATVEQQIAQFVEAKDSSGTPLRPHFEAVREQVFKMIPALKAQFPQDTVAQTMERAYKVAIHSDDGLAVEMNRQNEERIRADIEKAERARKAALASKFVSPGTPPNGQAGPAKTSDLRQALVNAFRAQADGAAPRV